MKRNIYLDYIRGLACLFVVLFHYTTRYNNVFGHTDNYLVNFPYGFQAVSVFFLLSGYLAIKNINNSNVLTYWVKKFFRLYPVYWVCIIITFIGCTLWLPTRSVSLQDMILNFTMLQGFDFLNAKSVDGAYWTLFYELFFYLLIWIVMIIKCPKHIGKLLVLWVIISLVLNFLPDISICNKIRKLYRLIFAGHWNSYGTTFIIGGLIASLDNCITNTKCSIKNKFNSYIYIYSIHNRVFLPILQKF